MEVTKEQIKELHKGLESYPEAQEAVKDAFPGCFKGEQGKDITEQIVWKSYKFIGGECWVMGKYGDTGYSDGQFYFNVTGFHFNNNKAREDFIFVTCQDDGFRIFKKRQ